CGDPGILTGNWSPPPLKPDCSPLSANIGRGGEDEIAPQYSLQEFQTPCAPLRSIGSFIKFSDRHKGDRESVPFQVGTIERAERVALHEIRDDVRIEDQCAHPSLPSRRRS